MSQKGQRKKQNTKSFSDRIRSAFGVKPDDRLKRTQGKFTQEEIEARRLRRK